jgi:D-alanyl-D-alanine carboxypeptidase
MKSLVHFTMMLIGCVAVAGSAAEDTRARLASELDRRAAEGRFAGAVLLAKDGEIVAEEARGLADDARKTPNTVDTKFRFGSMGKMFTAVAIVQLAQAGKLDLAAPLGRYLPHYPNQSTAKVTLHQLLTHTGGTGDIFGPEFAQHREELRTLADYVQLYGTRAPAFEPGSRHEYSNYGFILLGRFIDVVSGQD